MPDGSQHIQHFALKRRRHVDAVGGDDRQMELARESERGFVARFLFTDAMALQFDVDVLQTKGLGEGLQYATAFDQSTTVKRGCEWAFITAGQTDQSLASLFHLAERGDAFAFRLLSQLVARDELREVLITGL